MLYCFAIDTTAHRCNRGEGEVVFSDASLRQMAQREPITLSDFAAISGVGDRKLAQYGPAFTAAIRDFSS